MRIGLFGGTFDPPHVGHLILAERCREDAGLDAVWFVPCYRPPHKPDAPGRAVTRFDHRADMVLLATTGQPAFRVELIEKELPPPSYTAETLAELRQRHPDADFDLILGADSAADLPRWHEPRRVVEQAGLIVVPRPGADGWSAGGLAAAIGVPAELVRVRSVECPLVDVSSRDLRARAAAGKTVRFLLPRSVEEYIRERKLYRADAP